MKLTTRYNIAGSIVDGRWKHGDPVCFRHAVKAALAHGKEIENTVDDFTDDITTVCMECER